jgi:uncharacterized protein YijF (DUF1287 family)
MEDDATPRSPRPHEDCALRAHGRVDALRYDMRIAALIIVLLLCGTARGDEQLDRLLMAAHAQQGVTTLYDGSYVRLDYPGGDVPQDRGVCTDVVVRAYRAIGIDLQQRLHEDMRRNFASYPALWGLRRTDRNIDHRRVPNLARYFERHGESLARSTQAQDYSPGDLVTWRLPGNLPHIGIVSDRSRGDVPLIVHNVGAGVQIEDVLFAWPITGHYRYLPEENAP